jgi:hypothetical protein
VTLRRPFATRIVPTTSADPWSTTALPTGVAGPFDMRTPTGPAVVFVAPASVSLYPYQYPPALYLPGTANARETPQFMSGGQQVSTDPTFQTARLDHAGPLPTILGVNTGRVVGFNDVFDPVVSMSDKGGVLRLWASATADLQNGIWCEISRVPFSNVDAITTNLFALRVSPVPIGEEINSDDGMSSRFGVPLSGWPCDLGGAGAFVQRVLRLRFGYTLNGAEVVAGTYDALVAASRGFRAELALPPPLDYAMQPNPIKASVVFDIDGENPNQFAFTVPTAAALGREQHPNSRCNALQWAHTSPSTGPTTAPIPVAVAGLANALSEGVTTTVPRVDGQAETENLNHQVIAFALPAVARGTTAYTNTQTAKRPDILDETMFAVKNGPWWHEMALVSPGTSLAVPGMRHKLMLTFPLSEFEIPEIVVTGPFFPWDLRFDFPNRVQLLDYVLSEHTIAAEPTLDGRQLVQRCYAAREFFGPHEFDQSQAHFEFSVHAEMFVRTAALSDPGGAVVRWAVWQGDVLQSPNTNPWPSRHAALQAGMTQDEYDFYAEAKLPGAGAFFRSPEYVLASPSGGRITVDVRAQIRVDLFRAQTESFFSGPLLATGLKRVHHEFSRTYVLDLTREQCVDIANEIPVTTNGFTVSLEEA